MRPISADVNLEGARNFVDSMAQRGIGFLSDETLTQAGQKEEFKDLLQDSFDIKTIARFSLGRYWRVASEAEKKEYLSLFEKMIIGVYSQRFGEYEGQKFEIRDVRQADETDFIVSSFVVPESGPEIQIDWRVRYKEGRYKIIDVIVEGVSMAVTQRSDFASVIQRGGGSVKVLLDHLREK